MELSVKGLDWNMAITMISKELHARVTKTATTNTLNISLRSALFYNITQRKVVISTDVSGQHVGNKTSAGNYHFAA